MIASMTDPRPTVGMPISDLIRDGGALLLLLMSLFLPWTSAVGTGTFGGGASIAATRIEVTLITVLSMFSLSVTYLARFGVMPAGTTVQTVWLIRLLANAPYAVLVLVFLVFDTAGVVSVGVGPAAALGVAGALLAAQPRECEMTGQGADAAVARLWFAISVVVAGLVGVSVLLSLLVTVTPMLAYVDGWWMLRLVLAVLINGAAVLLPAIGLLQRREHVRILVIGVGIAMLFAALIAGWSFGFQPESNRQGGQIVLWWGVLLGIAASPGLRLAMHPAADVERWLRIVSTACAALIVAVGVFALLVVVGLSSSASSTLGFLVAELVLLLALGVCAAITRSVIGADLRSPAFAWALATGGIGFVLFVIAVVQTSVIFDSSDLWLGGGIALDPQYVLALLVGLPAVVIWALCVPRAMRKHFGPWSAATAGVPGQAYPIATIPAAAGRASPTALTVPPEALADSALRRAADPSADPADLYRIAQETPAAWPAIAANPATYPGLLEWLRSTGDPAVLAAIDGRSD